MSYLATADRPGGHPIVASLCTGPIFLVTAAIGALQYPPNRIDATIILIVPVAIAIGFIVSLLPNLVASAALYALGARNEATQLPVFWGLTGGLLAGGTMLAWGAPPELAGAFALTGAACALICRWRIEWP